MKTSVYVDAGEQMFVVEEFSDVEASALAALGFSVEDRTATATRHIDRYSRHVEQAFSNLAARLPTMVGQLTGGCPLLWEESLSRLVRRLDGTGVEWGLLGSAAFAARGVAITPGDIDVMTDTDGAMRLGVQKDMG